MCSSERLTEARPRSVGAWAVAICLADPRFRRAGFCPDVQEQNVKPASSGERSKYVARTQKMSMCSGSHDRVCRSPSHRKY